MSDLTSDVSIDTRQSPQFPRPVRIEGDVAYIPLTQELEAMIDASDLELIAPHKWYVSRGEWNVPYARSGPLGRMHRYIMQAPKEMMVDHINHNPLDNRRENLRLVTHQQNHQNRQGANTNNRLGMRGVGTWKASDGRIRYQSRVYVNGKCFVRYFPHTPAGLKQAAATVQEMRASLMPLSQEGMGHVR